MKGSSMLHFRSTPGNKRRRLSPLKAAIAGVAALLLALAGAAPAFADHTAGAELLDYGKPATANCTAGPRVTGIGTQLNSKVYKLFEAKGMLHLACYFEVPKFVPSDGEQNDWYAPSKPKVVKAASTLSCLAPGSEESDAISGPASTPRFLAYKTSLVMYCSWPLDEIESYPWPEN
jgi:hypothetical protein